ncbi:MAG: PAAR-like domain-containing protein [Myxococcota bacterium]
MTKGSNGIAAATVPNVCKMPGPPAPFVPAPLPNIGKSGDKPKGYTKKVKVEGKTVAIKGATFGSMGDAASKGTGGGLVSANTHGPTKFVAPGSLDVKFEGKNVQYLGDQMLNNCGPSGSPPNSATIMGVVQGPTGKSGPVENDCGDGNHSEVMEYCEIPPEEEDPNARVAAMRRAGTDPHEIKAALHDIDKGHITSGRQLSRDLTPEEKAEKGEGAGDEQKNGLRCTICGKWREVDQVHDDNHTVEAKDLKKGWGKESQKANNVKFAADGNTVTYKLKETKAKGQLGKEIWDRFKAGGTHRVKIVGV